MLHMYVDTLFQWHEIRKKGRGFVFYDLQPYYEVDADKRMVSSGVHTSEFT